tara:strand:- start:679 stop:957 length:279 start_codon:yes stop_codon:yes gene_type:complete
LDDNWYQSEWFGVFKHAQSEWIYHAELGWLYHGPVGQNGTWFWASELGWSWTREGLWPYLWKQNDGGWLYYHGFLQEKRTFWNFTTLKIEKW